MCEEMRLVSIGWPLSDALSMCFTMRKDGYDLERFVRSEEKKAKGESKCTA